MSNEIDDLMNLDPLGLTKDSPEIDAIIAYHRKNRALVASGVKPKKETGPKLDISAVMNAITGPKAPVEKMRRL